MCKYNMVIAKLFFLNYMVGLHGMYMGYMTRHDITLTTQYVYHAPFLIE